MNTIYLGSTAVARLYRGSELQYTGVGDYAIDSNTPPLIADFENERYAAGGFYTAFDSLFTFSRSGSATYVDSTGTIQTAADGEPRVGHHVWDGSAWVNEGILIESESRTNLATYSEDFSNAKWIKIGVTLGASATGPYGSATAVKIVETAASEYHSIFANVTASAEEAYTRSVFAKAGERSWVKLLQYDAGGGSATNKGVWFDLANGQVGTEEAGCSGFIEDVGGGWYRCSVSYTTSAGTTLERIQIAPTTGDGVSFNYAGDGTSGIYIWGAQLEAGSTPSSYIPTSGSTATRGAETLTIPAAKLPYSATAMSIAMEGRMTYADEGAGPILNGTSGEVVMFTWRKDIDNHINSALSTYGAFTGAVYAIQEAAGDGDFVSDVAPGSYSPGVLVPFSIAFRHGATFINGAVDGTALTANETPTALPDLSATDLSLAYDFMGTVKSFRMWATDIGDTGIEEASE